MERTKHSFNVSTYRTVSEKNDGSNYSYNVEMNEYANILETNRKPQLASGSIMG